MAKDEQLERAINALGRAEGASEQDLANPEFRELLAVQIGSIVRSRIDQNTKDRPKTADAQHGQHQHPRLQRRRLERRLDRGGRYDVGTMAEQDSEAQSVKVKTSGISLSGSSLFVGVAKQKTNTSVASTTNIGSLIGSEKGDVTLDAGAPGLRSTASGSTGALTLTGSHVVGTGTTTLAGTSVTIQNATDTVDTTTMSKSSSTGITIALNNPVVNGAQTVARMRDISQRR